MALNSLYCADVPLSNYSLTHYSCQCSCVTVTLSNQLSNTDLENTVKHGELNTRVVR